MGTAFRGDNQRTIFENTVPSANTLTGSLLRVPVRHTQCLLDGIPSNQTLQSVIRDNKSEEAGPVCNKRRKSRKGGEIEVRYKGVRERLRRESIKGPQGVLDRKKGGRARKK